MFQTERHVKKRNQQSHPDVVEGVCGVAWVVYEAISSIVALREGYPKLGVNILHELSSIMHSLDNMGLEEKYRKY